MHTFSSRLVIAAALAAAFGTATLAAPRPAAASTVTDILSAVVSSIITNNNATNTQLPPNTIVGRTADGGYVYADGHILAPSGQVYYASNNGVTPCSYINSASRCGRSAHAYKLAKHARAHWNNGRRAWQFDRDDRPNAVAVHHDKDKKDKDDGHGHGNGHGGDH